MQEDQVHTISALAAEKQITAHLRIHAPEVLPVTVTDVSDAENSESKHLRVSIVHNGAEVSEDVTSQLLSSPEMRELRRLMDKVDEVGDGPYNILKGQKRTGCRNNRRTRRYLGSRRPKRLFHSTLQRLG